MCTPTVANREDRRVEMISGASGAPAPGTGGVPGATAASPLPALEWKFSQVFGERAIGEEVQEGTSLDPHCVMDWV